MYIGGSIALLALGGILSFAVRDSISGVDLVAAGYICMVAGALGIIVSLILNGQRQRGVDRNDVPPR